MATVKHVGNPNGPPASSHESQPCNCALIWQTATLWSHETELITLSCPFHLHQWIPSIQNWMTFHFCVTDEKPSSVSPIFRRGANGFRVCSDAKQVIRECTHLHTFSKAGNLSRFSKWLQSQIRKRLEPSLLRRCPGHVHYIKPVSLIPSLSQEICRQLIKFPCSCLAVISLISAFKGGRRRRSPCQVTSPETGNLDKGPSFPFVLYSSPPLSSFIAIHFPSAIWCQHYAWLMWRDRAISWDT